MWALTEHTYGHIHPNLICTHLSLYLVYIILRLNTKYVYIFNFNSYWISRVPLPLLKHFINPSSRKKKNKKKNFAAYMSYLFRFVIQRTSHSAWASLSAQAARRAPWCTSSSGSPHAGSLPPQPYQYDSPDVHKHEAPLNHHSQFHSCGVLSLWDGFKRSPRHKMGKTNVNTNIRIIPPGE